MNVRTVPRGASWLSEPIPPQPVFTPEQITDEHRLIRQTGDQFVANEVLPAIERLEQKDWAFVRELVRKCADLGLIGTDVPEEYGGLALDKVSSLIVSESVGRLASWAVTFGGQTGLSITPLLCFGTAAQKQNYLPRLVSGEVIGAYALSETGSGSDALGARCRAVRQADGSFVLSGEKMWITNGGFADLFTVFAQVEDGQGTRRFTAFIVERAFPGVTTGKEEHKLGLHGSSTVPLILQDVPVPAENVLGEVGKGHKVAFNVLNYGRFKLGAMCSGGARFIIAEAAAYAAERRQFGQPLAAFGAIRFKLAEMTVRQYAVESMLFRIAGLLDGHGGDPLAALEEFAVEASIVKVAGSEMLDYVVDENVQIHGGNGFVRDYPAERHYRDARVNRIFEGTNEINRMLIPGMIAKRGLGPAPTSASPLRQAAHLVLSTAVGHYGKALGEQQEVLMFTADVLIDAFAAESVTLRAEAAGDPLHRVVAAIYANDALGRAEVAGRSALCAMGSAGSAQLARLRTLMDEPPVDTIPLRHQVAEALLSRRKYPFG